MKTRLLLILSLLVVSCGKTEAPKSDGEGSTAETSTSNTFNTGAPGNGSNGPTGSNDPVDPTTLPGYTPPPVANPTPAPTPGPTLTEVCGIAYSSFYDSEIRLYEDESTTHIVEKGDYSAEYYFASQRLTYPNDAKEVCVQSYMDNGKLVSSSVQIVEENADHPERPLATVYGYQVCGDFQYYTDNGGRTYLEVLDAGVPYIVVDENMPALELPAFSDSEGAAVEVKGCMYSNSAPYNDFSYTFKKHLNVVEFDFGPLLMQSM